MNWKKTWESMKRAGEKIGKKNLVIACSVLLIGAAVTVNWLLFGPDSKPVSGYDYSASSGMMSSGTVIGNAGSTLSGKDDTDSASYFAASQISRQRARDEAMEVLQGVVDNTSVDEEAKTKALSEISQIAKDMEDESNIETLVVSKGFEQCVAVVSGGTVSVIVKAEDLMDTQISQINEIVYDQTGILPANVKIIQK